MPLLDDINRVLRDFERYTGDGQPGAPAAAPLPTGDPSSGVHNLRKHDLRELLKTIAQTMGDPEALEDIKATSVVPLTITGDANDLIGTPPSGFSPGVGNTVVFTVQATNTRSQPTLKIGSVTVTITNPDGHPIYPGELKAGATIVARFFGGSGTARIVGLTENLGTMPAGIDLATFYASGNYLRAGVAVTDAPVGAGANALIKVEKYGNFVQQTWRDLSDPSVGWVRQISRNSGTKSAWQPLKPTNYATGKFTGARFVCLGDSITEGIGGAGYVSRLGEMLGVAVTNGGVGGACLSEIGQADYRHFCGVRLADAIATGNWQPVIDGAQATYVARGDDNRPQVAALAALDWSREMFVTFAFGTNDFLWEESQLGTAGQVSRTTIRGAVNYIIHTILTARPNLRLGFSTPIWRGNAGVYGDIDSDTWANPQGFTLPQMAAAILEEARRNHIPAHDAYNLSAMNRYVATSHYVDKTHPNDAGYGVLARSIAGFALAQMA